MAVVTRTRLGLALAAALLITVNGMAAHPHDIPGLGHLPIPETVVSERLSDCLVLERGGITRYILQFLSTPSFQRRKEIEETFGLRFGPPLGGTAWLVRQQVGSEIAEAAALVESVHDEPDVRSVFCLKRLYKLSNGFVDKNGEPAVPPQTRRKQRPGQPDVVQLIVAFDRGSTEDDRLADLAEADASHVAEGRFGDRWVVSLPENRIRDLEGKDSVRSISPGPPGPQDDNKDARGRAGVNADRAHDPGGPWGVDGSGITIGQWERTQPSRVHGDLAPRVFHDGISARRRHISHAYLDCDENGAAFNRRDDGTVDLDPIYLDRGEDLGADAELLFDATYECSRGPASGLLRYFPAWVRFLDMALEGDDAQDNYRAYGTIDAEQRLHPREPIYLEWADAEADTGCLGVVSPGDIRLTDVFHPEFARTDDYPPLSVSFTYYGSVPSACDLEAIRDDCEESGQRDPTYSQHQFWPNSVVGVCDSDVGLATTRFPLRPNRHSTHVAGTAIGSGQLDPNWKGVAPAAQIRSHWIYHNGERIELTWIGQDYPDAIANGMALSNNSWSHYRGAYHWQRPGELGYPYHAGLYDAVSSGCWEDGTPTDWPARPLIVATAGNAGYAERHTDTGSNAGIYDRGEKIYIDFDDDFRVSAGDYRLVPATASLGRRPVAAGDADIGNGLVNFRFDERHTFDPTSPGANYRAHRSVYRLTDRWERPAVMTGWTMPPADLTRWTVQAGDLRLGSFASPLDPPELVDRTDSEIGLSVVPFRFWGNHALPNGAKNTLSVGNLLLGEECFTNSPPDYDRTCRPSPDTGRGPTRDGRIKPDVMGPGGKLPAVAATTPCPGSTQASASADAAGICSTVPGSSYAPMSGTSMAAPAITGAAAMLLEHIGNTGSAPANFNPPPSLLRALLVHSARDIRRLHQVEGDFVGPDYVTGYGLVQVEAAIEAAAGMVTGVLHSPDQVEQFTIAHHGGDLKVTLAWDDPPAGLLPGSDARYGLLVNDLDLEMTQTDGSNVVLGPWQLDPANPARPAELCVLRSDNAGVTSDCDGDHRNTIEQILVPNAASGTWTISVKASQLNSDRQDFALVAPGIAGVQSALQLCD